MSTEKETPATPQIPTSETLTHSQALTVLINAARIGQEKGVYTLEEAEFISKAIKVFIVPVEGPQATTQQE
jgi:hypothetical protein